ncbi:DUF1273 domain-containing protein [Lacticaseibacillus pabuli]|uniref:DUF1273 domain-containing protein n=1 Tax=Lacticaseibacillus pabuli TaxID=3025672 RepID=A0ABY7WXY0_9LACO|nr:DUF1273 domain-containing protein [Lacticaseibacillus sp. KACC 23028]WDF83827.1 DUF1273 domain-containing protein [Lacticaseibacillus sp. KACC 23028]
MWVTGYRAYELNVFGNKDKKLPIIKYCLKQALTAQLDDGMEWLITGCDQGTDQWAAEVGLGLKKDYPELKIAMMAPYANFGNRWQEASQARLAELRSAVDFTADVSHEGYQSGRQLAAYGTFMSEHTDGAVMLYDTDYPGKAKFSYERVQNLSSSRKYNVSLITMYDLQEAATTLAEEAENGRFQDF